MGHSEHASQGFYPLLSLKMHNYWGRDLPCRFLKTVKKCPDFAKKCPDFGKKMPCLCASMGSMLSVATLTFRIYILS